MCKKPAAKCTDQKAVAADKSKCKKPKSKCSKKAVAAGTPRKRGRCDLKFPGVPKKHVPPMTWNSIKIYSDLNQNKWRIKPLGERRDRGVCWKGDAKQAWVQVLNIAAEMGA